MRLALMRWIDQLPKEELEAEFARLPAGEEEIDEWAAYRNAPDNVDDPYEDNSEIDPELDAAYQEMAEDEEREKEAFEWIEGVLDPDNL